MFFLDLPPQDLIKNLFVYDHETGLLTRKSNNTPILNPNQRGYIQVRIGDKKYQSHRLIWVYVNGSIPKGFQIDHINGDKSDNRLINLRLANGQSDNNQNTSIYKNNTSGYPGVSWSKKNKKWFSQIRQNKEKHFLGYYDSKEEAFEAYKAAKKMLHKFHGEAKLL